MDEGGNETLASFTLTETELASYKSAVNATVTLTSGIVLKGMTRERSRSSGNNNMTTMLIVVVCKCRGYYEGRGEKWR